MKKIAFISHEQLFPVTSGNRRRMFTAVEYLRSHGADVHFFLINGQVTGDMKVDSYHDEYFGLENFTKLTPNRTIINQLKYIYKGIRRKLRKISGNLGVTRYLYTPIDENCFEIPYYKNFDIVYINYIFNSWTLLHFGGAAKKILDTHDKFSERHERFKSFFPSVYSGFWIALTEKEEASCLKKFDVVLAIQSEEAAAFKGILSRSLSSSPMSLPDIKTVELFHTTKIKDDAQSVSVIDRFPKFFFLGSDNPSNIQALKILVEIILPVLLRQIPDFKLNIFGSVGSAKKNMYQDNPGLVIHGYIDDISTQIQLGDVLINPIQSGTGLAIKILDVLAYGCCVVGTEFGMRGFPEDIKDNNLLVNSTQIDELADMCLQIYKNPQSAKSIGRSNKILYNNWVVKIQKNLEHLI